MALHRRGLVAAMILWHCVSPIIRWPLPCAKYLVGRWWSTSANPQGQPAAISAEQVQAYFGEAVDIRTPGSVGEAAKPSEIRHLISGEIVREG